MGDEIRVALFDFMGDLMGGQLSFQEGDFIKQLDDPNAPQGWAMGEIDDFSGYFPLNFTVSWDFDKHGTEPQYKPEGHKTAPNVSPPPFSHSQQLDFTASFGGNFGGGGGGGRGSSALDSLSNLIDSILPPPGEDLGLPPAPPPAAAPQNGAQEEEEELTPLDRFKIPAAKPELIKKIDKPPPAPKEPVKQPEPESEAPKGPSMQELNEMKRQAREQRQMEMKKAKEEEERRLKEEKERKKAEKKKANADAASAAETASTTTSGPYSSISSSSAVPTFGYANNNLPKDPAALKRVSVVQLPGMAPLPDMKQLSPLEVTPLQIRSTFRDQVAQQQQQQPQEEQPQEDEEAEEEAPVIHPTAIPMPQPMAVPAPTPIAFHPQPTPSADPSAYNNEPRLPPKRTAPPPLPSRGNKPTSGPSEDESQQPQQPQPQPPFGATSLQRPVPPHQQPGNRPVPPQGRPIPPSPMARPSPPMNGGVAFGGAATPPPRPVPHQGPGAAGDGRPPMLPRPSSNRQSGQVGTLPSPRRETTGEQSSFRQQQQQAAPQQQPQPQGAGPAFNRRGSAPNLNVRIQPKSAQFAPPSPAAAPAAGTNGVAQQQHSHQQEEPRAPAQPPRPRGESVMVTVLEQVTCLHNFAGDATKNILAFNAGDVITVKRKNDSGWWTGELNGTLGYFPSNYTKPVPQQQPPQPHPPQQSPLQPSPPAGARHMGFGGGAASNTNNNASNAQTISGRAAPPPRPSAQSRFSLGAPIPSASMKVGGGTTITDRSKALNFQGFGAPHPTLGGGGAGGGVGDGGLSAGGVPSRNISSPNVRAQMIQPATAMAQSSSENSLRGPQGDAAGADGKKKKFGLFSKKKGGK
ncbi:Intersectin 1 (SH3 domain protein) [Balamuthia mandrillaris]